MDKNFIFTKNMLSWNDDIIKKGEFISFWTIKIVIIGFKNNECEKLLQQTEIFSKSFEYFWNIR